MYRADDVTGRNSVRSIPFFPSLSMFLPMRKNMFFTLFIFKTFCIRCQNFCAKVIQINVLDKNKVF